MEGFYEDFLSKFANVCVPGSVDVDAINRQKPLSPFQIKENLILAIFTANKLGKSENLITPMEIAKGRKKPIHELLAIFLDVDSLFIH